MMYCLTDLQACGYTLAELLLAGIHQLHCSLLQAHAGSVSQEVGVAQR
jgi:hypothetical protein